MTCNGYASKIKPRLLFIHDDKAFVNEITYVEQRVNTTLKFITLYKSRWSIIYSHTHSLEQTFSVDN